MNGGFREEGGEVPDSEFEASCDTRVNLFSKR